MNALASAVFTTSCMAAVVGIALLAVKRLLRERLSAGWQYALWLLLLVRLVLPFEPESALSLFNVLNTDRAVRQVRQYIDQSALAPTVPEASGVTSPPASQQATSPAAPRQPGQSVLPAPLLRWLGALPWVWAAGALGMVLCVLLSHVRFARRLRRHGRPAEACIQALAAACAEKLGIQCRIPVVVQEIVHTPALQGIFRHRILLPPALLDMESARLETVLLHECAHWKRRDNYVNGCLLLLQALHWFNPVLWLCFRQLRRDMELAVDESVLRALEPGAYALYAHTLLDVLQGGKRPALAPQLLGVVDDKRDLERRIRMMKKSEHFRGKRRWVALVGVLAVCILVPLLCTNALAKPAGETYAYADLRAMQQKRTRYVGDASAVGALIAHLPATSEYTKQVFFSLQTDAEPYGLTLYYEPAEVPDEDTRRSMRSSDSAAENNALLLFANIENLGSVTLAYRETPSDGTLRPEEYATQGVYTRADIEAKFGSIADLAADPERMQDALLWNRRIDGERVHANRVRWGMERDAVAMRNGEAAETTRQADGSELWSYHDLGGGSAELPDGRTETQPGADLSIYFDSPEALRDGIAGVYQLRAFSMDTEICGGLGIQRGTYDEVLFQLAAPTKSGGREAYAKPLTQAQRNAYRRALFHAEGLCVPPPPVREGMTEWLFVPVAPTIEGSVVIQYLYFRFDGERLTEHGLTVNEPGVLRALMGT